ncbi:MAG: ankyrin repeat domain-containing protein, partial [Pseudomonadota bacterium]|nr:ankyrin repeat domain-containing protein [Pseudomonadota bacterium]
TPRAPACQRGHLSGCQWRLAAGAAADITTASNRGFTPMYVACEMGHLSVCQWLFEVGAAEDITKAIDDGTTPMSMACENGNLSVCEWLILNGALNFLPPVDEVVGENEFATEITPIFDSLASSISLVSTSNSPQHQLPLSFQTKLLLMGHVDKYIVKRDTRSCYRPDLFAWAQQVVATHHTFFHTVLRASVILPDSHQQVSPDQRCHLPRLPREVLQLLGDMLGVKMGRQLRNAREFAEALVELQDSEIED